MIRTEYGKVYGRCVKNSENGKTFYLSEIEVCVLRKVIQEDGGVWSLSKAKLIVSRLLTENLVEINSTIDADKISVKASKRGELVAMMLSMNPEHTIQI